MARNPKDLVVSYYQFHRSLRTMSYRGTFQEFCRRFMNDKCECLCVMFPQGCFPSPQDSDNRGAGLLPCWWAAELRLRGVRKLVPGRAGIRCRSPSLSPHPWGSEKSPG